MRRLRDIADSVREQLAGAALANALGDSDHALIRDVKDVQVLHRPITTAARRVKSIPWLAYSFSPFEGLIEPFQIYPGRYWAFQQMHKQPSGLPELVTHISKEFPGASQSLAPHLFTGFSHSPNIETTVVEFSEEPLTLQFFESGALSRFDRTLLPSEFCLPGIAQALPQAYLEDDIPGMHGVGDELKLYLGSLIFYNQGRTVDRARLRQYLLNLTAVSVVLRYVRDAVDKTLCQVPEPAPQLVESTA
jgi:hypothetical protein